MKLILFRNCICLLFLAVAIPAFALSNKGEPKKTVTKHLDEQNVAMKKIHDPGDPTGNMMWFRGKEAWVTYYTSGPINRTDLNYANYLFKVYSMYCDQKGHGNQCLDNNLLIYMKVTGTSYKSSSLYVQVNGRTKTTNSFQELRSFLFGELERYGSSAPITSNERNKIQPAPGNYATTKFLIHTKSNGNGNPLWKNDNAFRSNMLKEAKLALGKIVNFSQSGTSVIKDDYRYGLSQYNLLSYYSSTFDSYSLTAAISSPNANDSGGVAWINGTGRVFVMKSCSDMHKKDYSFEKDTKCTAKGIFLHELGHVFGLRHCTTSDPNKQSSLCTDNYMNRTDGQEWFLNSLLNRTNSVSVRYAY